MTVNEEKQPLDADGKSPERGLIRRRGLMAGAAALTVGLLAQKAPGESVSAAPATMQTEIVNGPTVATTVLRGAPTRPGVAPEPATVATPVWRVANDTGAQITSFTDGADGMQGYASAGNAGVFGSNDGGAGIWGATNTGFAVLGDGNGGYGGLFRSDFAQLLLTPEPGSTPTFPTPGTHQKGELLTDTTGAIYYCIADGNPGTWRKLAGPAVTGTLPTAGTLHMLASPDRFVDTRTGLGGVSGTQAAGTTRVITMTGRAGQNGVTIPNDAVALVGNLTALGGTSVPLGSFLTMWPQGAQPPVANLNYGPGQIIANSFTCALGTVGASGVVSIFNHAPANYIVDVVGFYR